MFITQLEYREKPTATNWKRITFPKHVNLASEDAELPVRLLRIIAALPAFGRNEQQHAAALVAAVELDLGNGHVPLNGDGQEAEDGGGERDKGRALAGEPLHRRQPQCDRTREQGIGYEGHARQQV